MGLQIQAPDLTVEGDGITATEESRVRAGHHGNNRLSSSSRFDVFQLGEALLAGDAPRAITILTSLQAEGAEPTLVLWAILQEMRNLWLKLVPGAPIPGVWSSNVNQLPQAMARFRALPSARALFRRLSERASRVDRMIKGRLPGNAWDELLQLALDFAGQRALPLPRS
jgi:DNA polymerase-3 subunit delta